MLPRSRGLLKGPRSLPWSFNDAAGPLALVRLHSPSPMARRALTTGPVRKPQPPGASSRAPLSNLPPSRSGMLSMANNHSHEDSGDFGMTDLIPSPDQQPTHPSPLSILPLTQVLRSLLVSTVSSSKVLLPPSLIFLSALASSQSPLLNPEKNPLLGFIVKKILYAQFCAGESRAEVSSTIRGLKDLGYSGVILNYAREAESEVAQLSSQLASRQARIEAAEQTEQEVTPWAEGTMETVTMAEPGDFVAMKFSGAGRQALFSLAEGQPPPPVLASAIDSICSLAESRGVRLFFDAEQATIQAGIDAWTLEYMRKYNMRSPVVYGTYQAYLKSCPEVLASHLRAAREGGFSLGVKLVRGAYLGSDPRHLIHDTKEDTDRAYDSVAAAVLTRTWRGQLQGSGDFPEASLVVASHNAESVQMAQKMVERGEAKSEVVIAQLMGMADEISCTLLPGASPTATTGVKAYKYLVWGSTGECMKYLLRRAYENQEAVARTRDGRDAMGREVMRRVKTVFGF